MTDALHVASKCCDTKALRGEAASLVKNGEEALGLVMTPNACGLCAWRHDDASGSASFEGGMSLDEAFEIRAFSERWELRWIRDGSDGIATLMSEDLNGLPGWNDRKKIALAGFRDRRYLLWGEVRPNDGAGTGRLTLGNPRTGPMQVPLRAGCSQRGPRRIQLVAREYLAQFVHGNVCVFDQRLLKLIDADEGPPMESGS